MLTLVQCCCFCLSVAARLQQINAFFVTQKKGGIVRFHSGLFLRPTGVHDAHWGDGDVSFFVCFVIRPVSLGRLLFYFSSFCLPSLISKL
jgi:hypothetical protein